MAESIRSASGLTASDMTGFLSEEEQSPFKSAPDRTTLNVLADEHH